VAEVGWWDRGPRRRPIRRFLEALYVLLRSFVYPAVAVSAVLQTRGTDKPEEAVLQLYSWERDRLMGLAKGLAAAAVTVLATLIGASFDNSSTVSTSDFNLVAAFIAELLIWAGLILRGLQQLSEEYPTALRLV